MKYNEYKQLDYANLAEEVRAYWKENRIFEQSVETRAGQPTFVFYEGPPSANGAPGIHHVMARAVKDIFCRYKTLQGFQVQRKGGWDTHGLPIELQVEKELGITKEDIGKTISVEDYNARCRETVMRFKDQWDDLTQRMGYWVDLDNPYITFDNQYIESNWALLKKLYDKGYLYKGYTIQPYSPSDGTGLSSHELNQPGCYKEVKDTSIVAQFKVIKDSKSDFLFSGSNDGVYILAWTTTPWTLPSNTALAVGDKITYVQVNTFNAYTHQPLSVVLAKALVGKYFSDKNKDLQLADYKPGDKAIPFEIVQEFTGKQLVGLRYEQLMPYLQPFYDADKAFQVVGGDFVTTEDGTGVVHTSPTFGADDFRVAKQHGIPALTIKDELGNELPTVDRRGKFINEIGVRLQEGVAKYNIKTHKVLGPDDFYVKNYTNEDESHPDYKTTDIIISIILKEENKAFKVEKYEHTYPHSWRTDKPILYYPLDAWFIKTTAVKQRLIDLNKTINWKPESTGVGRFGNWLENLVDWNLSRSRYWGTPLPIWRTEEGDEEICIGSVAELDREIERSILEGFMTENPLRAAKKSVEKPTGTKAEHEANTLLEFAGEFALSPTGTEEPRAELGVTDFNYEGFDLHRPYVDNIILVSPSGKPMKRELDLIDVWFDSGAMPYAQWHYPFENKEIFEANFPADFIAEGVDQTRGWFFTLHALAVMLEDSVAFKNVIANGLVLDKNGNKMSKRLGNAIDPFETIGRFGPDATRWYMIVNAPPWDNLKFNLDGITEVQRRFFGTLQNTYSFFALYANLDGFTFEGAEIPVAQRTESDRWIISRLNTLVKEVAAYFDDYDPTKAARAIQDFVADELSNWYVRLNRKRFWKGELNQDKQAAYQTLYTCLETVAKLASPIAPFYMDRLFLDLNRVSGRSTAASIHVEYFPQVQEDLIDVDLEQRMQLAQNVSSLVHSLRKKHMIKVRQPLSRILIPILDEKMKTQLQAVEDLILSEVNVKSLEYLEDTTGILVKKIKPNFKRLGQVFGPKLKLVAAQIQKMSQEDILKMEREGFFEIAVEDDTTVLSREDVEIMSEDIPGWLVASEGALTVALDITITEELRLEGMARELVNRLQNLRKDSGLDVQDKIRVFLQDGNEEVAAAVQAFGGYISEEVQAVELALVSSLAETEATILDLEGFSLPVRLEVAR
ncbi:isoleucine--tRNA ligase [Rufibacter glacialis]|uniref:Isoleucine--tRNA ligase n=1 Tax=Rufibacter glacialis TaxID=1259555 RepID=A0A5M8QF11_9BACT|nr:isoleucine--tRNA ligase [Rufibacter glacialis]KAA6433554.1 isoleucine--tRNA ligase [Rufibacter glacialis]GGK73109.1 isoleucine--tRNA ligase [Rufibacter glacialis]